MKTSEKIDLFAKAFVKAQKNIGKAHKDGENPYFSSNYATLTSVMDACSGALEENNLSVLQPFSVDGDFICLETVLMHESGQWIKGTLRVKPVKNDPQTIGSTITYMRRYGLSAMVGVCNEDDDGNKANSRSLNLLIDAYNDYIGNKIKEAKASKHLDNIYNKHVKVLKEDHLDLHDHLVAISKTKKGELTSAQL